MLPPHLIAVNYVLNRKHGFPGSMTSMGEESNIEGELSFLGNRILIYITALLWLSLRREK
jgi:hypothetical protein